MPESVFTFEKPPSPTLCDSRERFLRGGLLNGIIPFGVRHIAYPPYLCAFKYVPLRYRPATSDEKYIRRIAWGLKKGIDSSIQIAAPAMATFIEGPCWLVPVPASNGSVDANLALSRAIAEQVHSARVKCAVARAHPVESSATLRLSGRLGLAVHQHAIIRTAGPMAPLPVYFVDNIITTGTTIAACRRALGWGVGLAYADASTPSNTFPVPFSHTPMKSTQTENQPVHRIRHGSISASIWRQETDKGPMFNVTFQRSYKEGDAWKSSSTFGQSNLLVLSLLATRAYEWISAQVQEPEA